MGFAQEISDAIDGFTSISKTLREDRAEARQAKYYDDLIAGRKQQQALAERKQARAEKDSDFSQGMRMKDHALALRRQGETEIHNANSRENSARRLKLDEERAKSYSDYMRAQAEKARDGLPPDTTDVEDAAAKRMRSPSAVPATPFPNVPTAPAPARPVGPVAAVPADPYAEDDEEEVPSYAEGGIVAGSAGDETLMGGAGPTAPTGQGDKEDTLGGFSMRKALESWGANVPASLPKAGVSTERPPSSNPVKLGLDAIQQSDRPITAVPAEGAPTGSLAQTLATNDGAAPPEKVAEIDQTIDPDGELNPAAKTIARLDAVTKHYLARGDVKKASAVAASLLLYGKQESQKLGSLAAVAVRAGNVEAAAKYLERAYDNIPDGAKLKTKIVDGKVHAVSVGADGKENELGTVDAPQLFKLALGVASGQEYMERMSQIAAGGKPPKAERPRAEKLPNPRDREKFAEMTNNAFSAHEGMQALLQSDKPEEKRVAKQYRSSAHDILIANPRMLPEDAIDVVWDITQVDPKNPNKRSFQTAEAQLPNGSPATKVTLADGRTVVIPQETAVMLGNVFKANQAKASKPQEASTFGKAMSAASRGIADFAVNTVKGIKNDAIVHPLQAIGLPPAELERRKALARGVPTQ